jgi:predicted GNAT family N-acyltransferase
MITLGAQLRLVRFYEGFGFAAASEPYEDFGVMHVDMTKIPRP